MKVCWRGLSVWPTPSLESMAHWQWEHQRGCNGGVASLVGSGVLSPSETTRSDPLFQVGSSRVSRGTPRWIERCIKCEDLVPKIHQVWHHKVWVWFLLGHGTLRRVGTHLSQVVCVCCSGRIKVVGTTAKIPGRSSQRRATNDHKICVSLFGYVWIISHEWNLYSCPSMQTSDNSWMQKDN
jgi:hypothetical protein